MHKKIFNICLSILLFLSVFSLNIKRINADTVIDQIAVNIQDPKVDDWRYLHGFLSDAMISYDANYEVTKLQYFDSSDTELEASSDHQFLKDQNYKLIITLKIDDGYTCDANTKAYVNGKEAVLTMDSVNSIATLTHEFKPFKGSDVFTVTYENSDAGPFKVGGGAYSNHQHSVDSRYFKCEDGKAIAGFTIDGVKYAAGVSLYYNLCKDIVIKPIYEDVQLYVEGKLVNSTNANDILGDGKVRYENNTLILNGASIKTVPFTIGEESFNNAIYSTGPLKILVENSSEIIDGNTKQDLKTKTIYSAWELTLQSQEDNDVLKIVNQHASKDYVAIETYHNLEFDAAQLVIDNDRCNDQDHTAIKTHRKIDIRNASNVSITMDESENLPVSDYETYGIIASSDLKIHESKLKVVIDDHAVLQSAFELNNNFIALSSEVEVEMDGHNITEVQLGIYGQNAIDIYETLFKMKLKGSLFAVGIRSREGMALEQLQAGSLIEVEADEAYALINEEFYETRPIELIEGQYTISASTQAILNESGTGTQYVDEIDVELEESHLKYDLNYQDGREAKIWQKSENSSFADLYTSKFLQTAKHDYVTKHNGDHHYKECVCGKNIEKEKHQDTDKDGKCDVCGDKIKEKDDRKDDYIVVQTAVK